VRDDAVPAGAQSHRFFDEPALAFGRMAVRGGHQCRPGVVGQNPQGTHDGVSQPDAAHVRAADSGEKDHQKRVNPQQISN